MKRVEWRECVAYPVLVRVFYDGSKVVDSAVGVGVLKDDAGDVLAPGEIHLVVRHDLDSESEGLSAGGEEGEALGMETLVGEEDGLLAEGGAIAERHGFGGGGGFVEERGVGDVEAGQIADHGLEVEEGLQTSLGDLGLVGRVLGDPARVLEDVALDGGRNDGVVVAESDV